jgi:hypothetical protein
MRCSLPNTTALTCRSVVQPHPRLPSRHPPQHPPLRARLATGPARLCAPTQCRVHAMVPIDPVCHLFLSPLLLTHLPIPWPVSSPTTGLYTNGSCYTAHKVTSLSSHVRCMFFTHPITSTLVNVTRYCIPTCCLPRSQFTDSGSASKRARTYHSFLKP